MIRKRHVVGGAVLAILLVAICGWRLTLRFEGLRLSRTERARIEPSTSSLDRAAGVFPIEVRGVDGGTVQLCLPEKPADVSPGKVVLADGTTILVSSREGGESRWYQDSRSEILARPMSVWELLVVSDQRYEDRLHFLREKCASRFNDKPSLLFNNLRGAGIIRFSRTDSQTSVVYCETNENDGTSREASIVVVGSTGDSAVVASGIAAGIAIVSGPTGR